MRPFVRLLCSSVAIGFALSCGILPTEGKCEMVGCDSGLTVRLTGDPTAPFRVEVFAGAPGQQPMYVYECADVSRCRQDAFFPGLILESAAIRVTTAGGSRLTTFDRIEYRTYRPNGDDCPPECRQAMVTADIPRGT